MAIREVRQTLPGRDHSMSTRRESVRQYVQVSEILLKVDDLTRVEIEVVREMLNRLSEKFNSEDDAGL